MAGRATPDPEALLCRARKTEAGLRTISLYTAQAEGPAWCSARDTGCQFPADPVPGMGEGASAPLLARTPPSAAPWRGYAVTCGATVGVSGRRELLLVPAIVVLAAMGAVSLGDAVRRGAG
jgi:hypothetical protein